MLELLQKYDYVPPTIVPGTYGSLEITFNGLYYYLAVAGEQWMAYNTRSHEESYEVFSHYYLAEGHVICTGMGLGARENWILTKKNVSKLTIIEKHEDVIKYHQTINSPFLQDERVEVICCDALEYAGKCDILLADHYELQSNEYVMETIEKVQANIDCDKLWFWPFERIIMNSRKWHTDNDPPYSLLTKHQAFQLLKKNHRLHKVPEFTEDQINLFCMMFHSKLFSKSEWILNEQFADRKVFDRLYRII